MILGLCDRDDENGSADADTDADERAKNNILIVTRLIFNLNRFNIVNVHFARQCLCITQAAFVVSV